MLCLKQEDGSSLELNSRPRRIVSLVPSITENLILFGTKPVARTAFCIEPKGQVETLPVIGGTKTPNLSKILKLDPDLVIANKEENLKEHVEALRRENAAVWVTYPVTPVETLDLMVALEKVCGASAYSQDVIVKTKDRLEQTARKTLPSFDFIVPIWKHPWMAAGKDTYIDAIVGLSGGKNALGSRPGRYPEFTLEDISSMNIDIVLLPSEPYAFGEEERRELQAVLPKASIVFFSGENLCWPGPRMISALDSLDQLRSGR